MVLHPLPKIESNCQGARIILNSQSRLSSGLSAVLVWAVQTLCLHLQKPPCASPVSPRPTAWLGENHLSQTLFDHLSPGFPRPQSQPPSSAPRTLLQTPGSWQPPPPPQLLTPQEFASSKAPGCVLSSTQHSQRIFR